MQRKKLTTVVKNTLQIVNDLVTGKIEIEVGREAKGPKVAVIAVDVEKCLAADEH